MGNEVLSNDGGCEKAKNDGGKDEIVLSFCFKLNPKEIASLKEKFAMRSKKTVRHPIVFADEYCRWQLYDNDWWKSPEVYEEALTGWIDRECKGLYSWEAYVYGLCFDKKLVVYKGEEKGFLKNRAQGRTNHKEAVIWYKLAAEANCVDAVIELIKLNEDGEYWRERLKKIFDRVDTDKRLKIAKLMWPIDTDDKNGYRNSESASCRFFVEKMLQSVHSEKKETRREIYLWMSYIYLEGYFGYGIDVSKGMLFAELAALLAGEEGEYGYSEFDLGMHTYYLAMSYRTGKVKVGIPGSYRDNGDVWEYTDVSSNLKIDKDEMKYWYWMERSNLAGYDLAARKFNYGDYRKAYDHFRQEMERYKNMLLEYDRNGIPD